MIKTKVANRIIRFIDVLHTSFERMKKHYAEALMARSGTVLSSGEVRNRERINLNFNLRKLRRKEYASPSAKNDFVEVKDGRSQDRTGACVRRWVDRHSWERICRIQTNGINF